MVPANARGGRHPSGPLVYVDRSDVRPGTLDSLRSAIEKLARFVEANEPQLLAYSVYLSENGDRMTVVHVHSDSASLEYHLEIGGPEFRKLAGFVVLTSIEVYGEPSEKALQMLHDKARGLGSGVVAVHAPHAGFSRFEPAQRATP